MRGSGWFGLIAALALTAVVIVVPLVAAFDQGFGSVNDELLVHDVGSMFRTSLVYAIVASLLTVAVGWLPGRVLGAWIGGRRGGAAAMLAFVPLCLPGYLVFYCWWQSWPPDSAIYGWVIERDLVTEARVATLLLGFVCRCWPLVALPVAIAHAARSPRGSEMLAMDGARGAARFAQWLRADLPALLLGGGLVFLAVFNDTTSFDLAGVYAFGFGLRAMEAVGGGPTDVLAAARPAMLVAAIGAVAMWITLGRRGDGAIRRHQPPRPAVSALVAIVWAATVFVPLALFTARIGRFDQIQDFVDFYGASALRSVAVAAITGLLGAVLAIGIAHASSDRRRSIRVVVAIVAVGWLLAALVPGTVVGAALEAAWNRNVPIPFLSSRAEMGSDALGEGRGEWDVTLADLMYLKPCILVLGELARFGFVPVLLGRWAAHAGSRSVADTKAIDGATTLPGFAEASRPALVAAAATSAAVVAALSLGEVIVQARLAPPGYESVAAIALNDMHYQRPETVLVAAFGFIAAALAAAVVAGFGWSRIRGRATLPLLVAVLAMTGCGGISEELQPVPAHETFGSPGRAPGQFNYPRAIAVDGERGYVYIVDKSAFIQRFDLDGNAQLRWQMPDYENGKPTGLNVGPDGNVYVPDTHYHRVVVFTPDGDELLRFGKYGEGPGEFIYPTDVAFHDDHLYVAEYGGHDRIQVFTRDGEYVREFGTFGEALGEYSRPQSMAVIDGHLLIADACNHRIVRVQPDGTIVSTFGVAGRGFGELAYPYDLVILPDQTLLVAEFGNNRVQHFSLEGEPLGIYGGIGRGDGQLQYPWGVDSDGEAVFVVDSGNNRVQIFDTEQLP